MASCIPAFAIKTAFSGKDSSFSLGALAWDVKKYRAELNMPEKGPAEPYPIDRPVNQKRSLRFRGCLLPQQKLFNRLSCKKRINVSSLFVKGLEKGSTANWE